MLLGRTGLRGFGSWALRVFGAGGAFAKDREGAGEDGPRDIAGEEVPVEANLAAAVLEAQRVGGVVSQLPKLGLDASVPINLNDVAGIRAVLVASVSAVALGRITSAQAQAIAALIRVAVAVLDQEDRERLAALEAQVARVGSARR
jgi:hypothetical protein